MLEFLLSIPKIGRILEKRMIRREGGEMTSILLRKLTLKRTRTEVGLYSYGGCFSKDFNVGGEVTVGRYCSIAKDVHYFGANHPIKSVSTSALFYNKKFGFNVNDVKREKLQIGNDVWIGYGVIITAGCHTIGDGAVIGAGAVVTKDVAPYSIVAGVPAKEIGFRFSRETISELAASHWYSLPPEELMRHYSVFDKPDEFCRRIQKEHFEG